MKTLRNVWMTIMVVVAGFGPGAWNVRSYTQVSASVQISATADFYAPLTPYGAWVEVGTYGRCWRPAHVAVGWRPYCTGEWVWTDCGWYWETDEPWGWACYHYGSWVLDPGFGWVWVPGVEWSPAWVEWRVGGGYIGWAPCAPRGVVVAGPWFAFVAVGHFHERIHPSVVVVNNTTIINQTTRMASVERETRSIGGKSQTVVIHKGPEVGMVEKAAGTKLAAVPVHEAMARTRGPDRASPAGDRKPDAATGDKDRGGGAEKSGEPDQPSVDKGRQGDGGATTAKPEKPRSGQSGRPGSGKGGKDHGRGGGGGF